MLGMRDLLTNLYWNLRPRAWMKRTLSPHRGDEIEMTLLRNLVDPNRCAIDVGAHVGAYAFRLARMTPTVHALEPDRALADRLERVAPANVRIHRLAASRRAGTGDLVVPVIGGRMRVCLGSLESQSSFTKKTGVRITRTQLVSLDDLISEPIGFIKIDVEGHELAVLQGATRILRHDRPTVLVEVEERHKPGSVAAVRRFMHRFGYTGFFVFGLNLRSIDDFTLGMQNPNELNVHKRRIDINYINNFIYVHAHEERNLRRRFIETH